MANMDENIIIIKEDEAAGIKRESEEEEITVQEDESKADKKKKLIIFGLSGTVLIIIISIAILFLTKSPPEKKVKSQPTTELIEDKLTKNRVKPIEPSKLENMIAKANYLYANGSKPDALFLYEKIATYSEAISLYNLGVAQLKNKQYQMALSSFQKAIKNNEKRCVSAINAAVCSLHLKDKENFRYYINLAKAYLSYEVKSPLYSYYYALIYYYNNNYLEALVALKHNPSTEYPEVQKHLKAKLSALFNNNYEAVEAMEKKPKPSDDFNIALLYARIGDYPLAINHLNELLKKTPNKLQPLLARGFIKIKAGAVASGTGDIKKATDKFDEEVYKYYPIKVFLKKALFNPTQVQKHYREDIQDSKFMTYQKIFYFSPYKLFNPNIAINYIQKGNANMYIDNIQSAQEYLKTSASSSNANIGIAKAIKKALEFQIRSANKELQELVKVQPKHSILHYNLALTYAQLGDMPNANKHFLLSYHLNAKNYLSGIFAIMTSQLINKKSAKLESIIKDDISNEEINEEIDLYKTLLYITDTNYVNAINWLNKNYKEKPLYLVIDTIIASKLNKMKRAEKASKKLIKLLPHDILPHLIYIDNKFYNLKPKLYANKVLNYLKLQKFNFTDLYYGPYITRYLYIQQKLMTGKLYFLRQNLKNILASTQKDTTDILSALALASFYDSAFEESYTLYNTLIDEHKVRDANTLFLGAVASTAANHHENAIALLELSKMKNKKFLESRYALGLLYLEVENNQGAIIQLLKVEQENFHSEYFDFDIDTDKLLFKKQHP